MPPENAQRLEKLLDAAGRTVQPTQPGWQTLPQRLARTPQSRRRRTRSWLWLVPAPFGIAAAVALWLAFSSPKDLGTSRVQAEGIVVQRQDVELTVLSVAETEGETLYMPILQKLGQHLMPQPNWLMAAEPMSAPAGRRDALRPRPVPPIRKLPGQALVKDHRLVLNLKQGYNTVRFTEVAATIDPTSVRFVSNTDPAGTQVVEQNFEYDLANADALLKRYLDRKIICIAKDGQESSGYLASFDDKAIVLASEPTPPAGQRKPRSTQSLSREGLQAVRLEEMPGDLLVKPTLVWKLRTRTPGKHDTTLSYLCGFVKWRADYVALVAPGEGQDPDILDITGWVSLDNTSGAIYEKAGLKLIAGDVSRVRDPWAVPDVRELDNKFRLAAPMAPGGAAGRGAAPKEFVEKSFFEYHLYTLTAPSTVHDKQIKQLNLLQRKGVKATRRYIYDPQMDNRRVSIELVAKNDKDNKLGVPLPKGRVTLEQRDRDGETGFLGHVDIDHTAVKEELKLKYGHAYDVTGEFSTPRQLAPNRKSTTYEMRVRNYKTEQIQVRAVARLGLNWTITKSSLPFQSEDAQTVHFDFPLKPNSEQVISYTVEYRQ